MADSGEMGGAVQVDERRSTIYRIYVRALTEINSDVPPFRLRHGLRSC